MSAEIFLLVVRLGGAVLLLAFIGGIAWLLRQDIQLTAAALAQQNQPLGVVRLLREDEDATPTLDASFPLLSVTSIGRAATNLVVLDDAFASNEHALLTRRGSQWWLEDLGSRNGTMLNDVPLAETAVVSPGDVITIGNTKLMIEEAR